MRSTRASRPRSGRGCAALAEARRSPTVEASLRVARLIGTDHDQRRGADAARLGAREPGAGGPLSGVRRTELGYVVDSVRALAASHQLTADRLDPTFLIMNANVRFWPASPLPAPALADDRSAAIPRSSSTTRGTACSSSRWPRWGRANAIAGACLAALRTRTTKDTCRTASMTRWLDRLLSLGARRSGYLAWEYYFAYGSGIRRG